MDGDSCECGYEVDECEHDDYTDTYITSECTGYYTTSKHKVIHYYQRECDDCGESLGERTETVWAPHRMEQNKCECGYEVNFTAHEFLDWEVIESPTEMKDGVERTSCKCGYEKQQKIKRLGVFNDSDAKKKGVILIFVSMFLIVGVTSMRKRKV
jgi:hypothetical protein